MRRSRPQRGRNRDYQMNQARRQASSSEPITYFTNGLDINSNLGEGFGPYKMAGESELLPFVTSVNVACGAHAGDPSIMATALEEVRKRGLALGAHIGYPDLQGFGRREIHLPMSELHAQVLYQLGALAGLAHSMGLEIVQVRPHGFLYRQMSSDLRVATAVARAVAEFDQWLILIGLAGTTLNAAAEKAGIRVAGEAWVDRVYDSHGNLLPHSHSRALIESPKEMIEQASNLINNAEVVSVDGSRVRINFQTLHFHSHLGRQTAQTIREMIPYACALNSEPFTIDPDNQSLIAYGH